MSNTERNEPTEQPEMMDIETARRVEQEIMTRRSALRKLGFGAGLAAFSMLGVDDFARMVGKRMERMARDNKVAAQVAKEFNQAGVAFAGSPSAGSPSSPPTGPQCPASATASFNAMNSGLDATYAQCSSPSKTHGDASAILRCYTENCDEHNNELGVYQKIPGCGTSLKPQNCSIKAK